MSHRNILSSGPGLSAQVSVNISILNAGRANVPSLLTSSLHRPTTRDNIGRSDGQHRRKIETVVEHFPCPYQRQENAPRYFIRETMSGSLWQQFLPAGHLLSC
jgi:hypothetical protein